MKWRKSSPGMLEVELTSAQPEAALEAAGKENICISHLTRSDELRCRFRLSAASYGKLQDLAERRGDRIRVLKKRGWVWMLRDLENRRVLLTGIGFLLVLTVFLPTRVLFIRVEGNRQMSQQQILEAAESCGIRFGASRRAVRSERVKNALLAALPQLQWAGVNTSGCVAVISVREGNEPKAPEKTGLVTSIAAVRDGYILSGTVTRGQGLFQLGQTVKKGEILISGYTDCGLCIRAGRAEGEVFAQTEREIELVTPSSSHVRTEMVDARRCYSLIFRKKRINLWKDSGISPGSCGRMYKEYYITLPGGFRLPFALCIEEIIEYRTEERNTSLRELQSAMSAYAQHYVTRQMIAGSIVEGEELADTQCGVYSLTGKYVCTEMIGREVAEQIGDTNGKSS